MKSYLFFTLSLFEMQAKQFLFLFILCSLCLSAVAQDYCWSKAVDFPSPSGSTLAVKDLQAADGVIRFNAQWYMYEGDTQFKRIETLVNPNFTKDGNFLLDRAGRKVVL